MLRGLTNVSFWTDDVKAARQWYTALLGTEPYFQRPDADQPAYLEYRIGDFPDELGIIDAKYAPPSAAAGPGGAVVYWHVDDVPAALAKLTSLGATEYEPLTKRGDGGWVTASVIDPFGNIIGLIHSPHYLEVLAATGKA